MKNIFLIGDSIRFGAPPNSPGYGLYVKEALNGKANVYAPEENCRMAQYTLRYLHEWAKNTDSVKIDIVHWNNGLWDVLRINKDEPLTPCDVYVNMLERVYRRIVQLFPDAKIIFATSTAVIEEWADPDFFRYNTDIEKYNEAAKQLMNRLNVEVNDLYGLTKGFGENLHSDWVHFNEKGSRLIADYVVKNIEKNMWGKSCE